VVERRTDLEQEEDGGSAADPGETQSLIGLLANTPSAEREDVRRRLRVRIAQLVGGVWVVVARQGKKCVCGVQLFFRGGDRRRDDLILHSPGNRHREGGWRVWSLADAIALGELDLRKPAHAKRLETALVSLPLEALE
jgi:hypothetical protein